METKQKKLIVLLQANLASSTLMLSGQIVVGLRQFLPSLPEPRLEAETGARRSSHPDGGIRGPKCPSRHIGNVC